jgi:transposase-like protein
LAVERVLCKRCSARSVQDLLKPDIHATDSAAAYRQEETRHGPAKSALHAIWQANSRNSAEKAFDRFIATYEAKHPKAVDSLSKYRDALLAFYDFPAAHWQHLRITNPIELTFATVRLCTVKTRNYLGAKSGLRLVHQLAISAQKRSRKIRGFRQLADVIAGVGFIDGIDESTISRKAA